MIKLDKKKKTVLRIVLLSLVALIVGVNIYAINASRVAGNALPMPFGIGATVVLSGSMEPELSTGDLLIVVKDSEYELEDVVVYQSGKSAVVHRIIDIDGESITTKGDANNAPDDPITVEHIKGRVLWAIPYAGYAVNIIKTPICTVVILAAALFLLERSFRAEKKSNDSELQRLRDEIEALKDRDDAE